MTGREILPDLQSGHARLPSPTLADPQPSPWEWSSCPEADLRYLVAPEVASLFWIDTRGPIHGCLYSDISRPRPRFTAAAKFSSLPPNRLTHSSSVVSARHLKTRGA